MLGAARQAAAQNAACRTAVARLLRLCADSEPDSQQAATELLMQADPAAAPVASTLLAML